MQKQDSKAVKKIRLRNKDEKKWQKMTCWIPMVPYEAAFQGVLSIMILEAMEGNLVREWR